MITLGYGEKKIDIGKHFSHIGSIYWKHNLKVNEICDFLKRKRDEGWLGSVENMLILKCCTKRTNKTQILEYIDKIAC